MLAAARQAGKYPVTRRDASGYLVVSGRKKLRGPEDLIQAHLGFRGIDSFHDVLTLRGDASVGQRWELGLA